MRVVVLELVLLCFALPVVILELVVVAPGPTLPSLDAPGAGCGVCVCADAIAVVPNNAPATRPETASLHRIRNLLLLIDQPGLITSQTHSHSVLDPAFSPGR